ncbi:hypothetical protein [Ideonella livida]|uniref:Uncharacterized protein n=1 Tax=Ideonella livida TaxID=2707176 RepID=A0A7C9PET1_9BURK|nr:hypothetical protein [Ideonella livida]NDY90096.1 hypothetical protein [Ideonella livida]
MSNDQHPWLAQVLGVSPPWKVTDVKLLAKTGLVSIQIEKEEAQHRFWMGRRPTPQRRLRWDHIGMAGYRCEIVLLLREGQSVPEAPWTGSADLPFTRHLSRLVLDLMLEGATMSQLCRMLELPFSELWKYKFRLDQGSAQVPATAAATTPPAAGTVPAPPAAATGPASPQEAAPTSTPAAGATPMATGPAGLPPADAPLWLRLLKGELTLDVQALSLKLLLSKASREARLHEDDDLHRQAAQALHRYFERNVPILGHEIRQLQSHWRAAGGGGGGAAAPATLPDVSDPLWQDLLMGERDLDVRALSLRLLLSKLRGQARALQDDELRMLKLVELHRFFEKNQATLRHEISQISRWSLH